MADERNPFSMTPKVGRASASPDLAMRKIRKEPQEIQQDPLEVVSALVKFAGVGTSEYVASVEKRVEADKLVQTSLAEQGMRPSDEATKAGYRAHAAVSMKAHALGAQARLNQLAQQDLTDEQWSEAVKEEYRNQDEYLESNYEGYKKDIDLQKLAAVSLREIMPQVGAKREAARVDREIQSRVDDASAALVNATLNPALSTIPTEELMKVTEGMLGTLQLTASQKDKALENAIVESRNPELIRLAESFKGDRKSSLFSRSGKIQQVKAQLDKETLANQAIAFEKEAQTIETAFLDGSMTLEEVDNYLNKRNKETDQRFFSRARYGQLISKKDKATATANITQNIAAAIADPERTNIKDDFKEKDIQATYVSILKHREEAGEVEADRQGLEGPEKVKFMKKWKKQTQAYLADKSVKSNDLVNKFQSTLSAFANTNVAATGVDIDLKGGGKEQQFSPQAQEAVDLLDNMSDEAKRVYLDSIKDKEAEIVKNYLHQREMGEGGRMSGPQALLNAQVAARNKSPKKWDEIDSTVKSIVNSELDHWIAADIPDNMREYWTQEIRKKVISEPNPGSDIAKKMVRNYMQSGVTTTSGGMKLNGSPQQLKEATNMHIDHLDRAMEAFVKSRQPEIQATINGLGLSIDDVFPVTDPKSGMMYLSTDRGEISSTRTPMSELVNIDRKYNHEASKIMWKNWQTFERLKRGGPLYIDEKGDPLYGN